MTPTTASRIATPRRHQQTPHARCWYCSPSTVTSYTLYTTIHHLAAQAPHRTACSCPTSPGAASAEPLSGQPPAPAAAAAAAAPTYWSSAVMMGGPTLSAVSTISCGGGRAGGKGAAAVMPAPGTAAPCPVLAPCRPTAAARPPHLCEARVHARAARLGDAAHLPHGGHLRMHGRQVDAAPAGAFAAARQEPQRSQQPAAQPAASSAGAHRDLQRRSRARLLLRCQVHHAAVAHLRAVHQPSPQGAASDHGAAPLPSRAKLPPPALQGRPRRQRRRCSAALSAPSRPATAHSARTCATVVMTGTRAASSSSKLLTSSSSSSSASSPSLSSPPLQVKRGYRVEASAALAGGGGAGWGLGGAQLQGLSGSQVAGWMGG
jgi:hypothetical protein